MFGEVFLEVYINCKNIFLDFLRKESIVYFYFSPRELTDAYRYLEYSFLKQLAFCENNRKVEFLKILSPRAEDSAKSKA